MKVKLTEKENEGVKYAFVEWKKKKSLVTMCSAIAEAQTEDSGEKVYITAQWMDQNPDEIYFEVTPESIYDFLTFKRDDIEVLDEIRENLIEEYYTADEAAGGRFAEICSVLSGNVAEMLKENGADADTQAW